MKWGATEQDKLFTSAFRLLPSAFRKPLLTFAGARRKLFLVTGLRGSAWTRGKPDLRSISPGVDRRATITGAPSRMSRVCEGVVVSGRRFSRKEVGHEAIDGMG